jgi:nucleotide-binding universal stress UspA family protein
MRTKTQTDLAAQAWQPHKIEVCLVPLDGTKFAQLALVVAKELAERLDVRIEIVSAVAREEDVPVRYRELANVGLGTELSISVVVDLDPPGVIHENLKRLGCAVACLASHGRSRGPNLRPSVPNDVIARGHDPVLVAGPNVGRPKGVWWDDAQLSLSEFRGGGVLACLDGTAASRSLVDIAAEWAARLTEPLIAATVAEPDPALFHVGERLFGPKGDVDAYLASMVEPTRGRGVEVLKSALYDPVGPAEGIGSYLEESPAALVIVGAHHRGRRPKQLALAGTPARIVRRSPSPVLVVPQPGRPSGGRPQ